jgi:flagellar FliL protein
MAQAAAADAAPAPKSGGKTIMIIAAVVALAIGAGVTWFLASGSSGDESEPETAQQPPSVFYPLQTFTVNLVPEFGDQYLQVEMTLKVRGQDVVETVKARMPEVRNRVIMILSSKRASELTTVSGKSSLARTLNVQLNSLIDPTYQPPLVPLKQIDATGTAGAAGQTASEATAGAQETPDGPIREVLFTSFIVQ